MACPRCGYMWASPTCCEFHKSGGPLTSSCGGDRYSPGEETLSPGELFEVEANDSSR